jgi:hypothetical protein
MKLAMATALAVLALGRVAAAQPRLVPTGDVQVTYQLSGSMTERIPGGAPDGVRLMWDAAGQRLRTEPVGRPMYAITDLGRHVADLVFAAQSSYLEMPLRVGDPQTLLTGADVHFTRQGTARLLGMGCTEWRAQSRKLDVTGCVTPDGIVLRADGTFDGRPGTALATSITRGPVPAANFQTPPGFFRLPLSGLSMSGLSIPGVK